jgi:hypothetical protein
MTQTRAAVQVQDVRTISRPRQQYIGWPTLGRLRDGRLLAVCSGGREHHVCPFGQVQMLESRDEGETWSWARTLVDGQLDDRDAGVLQTPAGTLLVNWFTSTAWEHLLRDVPEAFAKLPADEQAEWKRRLVPVTPEVRRRELGCWAIRSTDGGVTWSGKIDTIANSPHGPCMLRDGRILYVGRRRFIDEINPYGGPFCEQLGASVSDDDGLSWRWIGNISAMPGHSVHQYHEAHAVQSADGRVIAHLRNHNEPHKFHMLQTESSDGGVTWSEPRSLGFYGYPPHLLRLEDGRLMTTFGRRLDPKGNQISLSEDHGRTWSEPVSINTDSQGDLGYPSTVQLGGNRFATLWYDTPAGATQTVLRLARWTLG